MQRTLSSLRTLVFVLCASCAGASGEGSTTPDSAQVVEAGDQQSGAPGQSCSQHLDCGWGHRCEGDLPDLERGAGRCAEAECHDASETLPARACPAPQTCSYEDGFALENGLGFCETEEAAP